MSKKIDDDELKVAVADVIELARTGFFDESGNNDRRPGRKCQIDQAALEADVQSLIQLLGEPARKQDDKVGLRGRPSPSSYRH